jgi:prepilin-type N-terminal cleavage/methylation domain-containing protein
MHRSRAFTLIELSIVLLILSVIMGGAMTYLMRRTQQDKLDDTYARMDVIEDAILNFRRANGRLPCPASYSTTLSSSTFGTEAANPGTCTGAANLNASQVRGGALPTKALNLPDDYEFDGWGRRFDYAVDVRATNTNAFTVTYGIADATVGEIIVKDASGTTITSKAVVLVMSHGSNGHGAYMADGTGLRFNASVTNTDELENCNCTSAAAAGTVNATYVQKMPVESTTVANTFDDIVRYKMRWQLYSLNPAETTAVTSF